MAGREKQQESLGYRIALGGVKGLLRILILAALVIILIWIAQQTYALGYEVFHEKPVDTGEGRAVTVTITDDMSVRQIGTLLKADGLITESTAAFMIQEFISEYHGELLPGTYVLRTSMTADEMFPILAQKVPSETLFDETEETDEEAAQEEQAGETEEAPAEG